MVCKRCKQCSRDFLNDICFDLFSQLVYFVRICCRGYDLNYYAKIFNFAYQHKIRIIGLSIPQAVTRYISLFYLLNQVLFYLYFLVINYYMFFV